MKNFTNFVKRYDLLNLFFIFVVISFLFLLSYGKLGSYLVDVGREVYLPWRMIEGDILYKDLFNMYGPLGYQINAILFKIFGINLNTLYCAGFFSSVFISYLIYLISKLFVNKKIALSVVFVVLTTCVFSSGLFNFIFPYSYNAVYALLGLLVSLYTALLFIKKRKYPVLILSYLFAGFAFANKIEYAFYFAFLFICLPFFLKNEKQWCKNLKSYIYPVLAFFVFPLLSFGFLLLQGVTISELLQAYKSIVDVVKAPATDYYYNAYGLYFHPLYAAFTLKLFLFKILTRVVPVLLILFLLNFYSLKFLKNKYIKYLFNFIVFLFSVFVIQKWFGIAFDKNIACFSWIALILSFVFLGFVFYLIIKFFRQGKKLDLSKNQMMFLFLLISSLAISVKGFAHISIECYGTFSLAILFLVFVIFSVCYVPKIFKISGIKKDALIKSIANMCFIISILYFSIVFANLIDRMDFVLKTDKGVVYLKKVFNEQKNLIDFIKENTPKDSTLVVLPEGGIINFLSERKSHGKYYFLIPGNVQAFGQDSILEDFKKNPPDYFLLNNTAYDPYNVGDFRDYGSKITDFIFENYNPVYRIDNAIIFILFERKNMLK